MLDARMLAHHSITGIWKPSFIPTESAQVLRVLWATRAEALRAATRASNRLNKYGIGYAGSQSAVAAKRSAGALHTISSRQVIACQRADWFGGLLLAVFPSSRLPCSKVVTGCNSVASVILLLVELLAPKMLEFFLNQFTNVQVVLYLGDGANSGCADELQQVLDTLRRRRGDAHGGVPIFYVIGNHDYLGIGTTTDPLKRQLLCGPGNSLSKYEVIIEGPVGPPGDLVQQSGQERRTHKTVWLSGHTHEATTAYTQVFKDARNGLTSRAISNRRFSYMFAPLSTLDPPRNSIYLPFDQNSLSNRSKIAVRRNPLPSV